MILTMPFQQNELVDFDQLAGNILPVSNTSEKIQGVFHFLNENSIALYADNDSLILQIDKKIWDVTLDYIDIKYYHKVRSRKTYFEIVSKDDSFVLEYDAWWADIPDFEPVEPEMDEDEDFMGYIYAVSCDQSLKKTLIDKWT